MKIGLKIMPRQAVLDTQGRAVESTLRSHGHSGVACTVGKYILLDVPGASVEAGLAKAREMAELVLYNPLIETYELDALP